MPSFIPATPYCISLLYFVLSLVPSAFSFSQNSNSPHAHLLFLPRSRRQDLLSLSLSLLNSIGFSWKVGERAGKERKRNRTCSFTQIHPTPVCMKQTTTTCILKDSELKTLFFSHTFSSFQISLFYFLFYFLPLPLKTLRRQ